MVSSSLSTRVRLWWLSRLPPGAWQGVLVYAAVIGVLGALVTLGFREVLAACERALFHRSDGLVRAAAGLMWWQRLLYPTLGGVCAGLVLRWAGRWGSPTGAVDYMEALALGDGRLAVRSSLIRALSSALSVASGAALGREASMVQLAALTGSLLGRAGRVMRAQQRLLVACGAAAGITAAYNAPIAGALFVSEIILQSFAIESLGPLIVAAVASYLTIHPFMGGHPVYHMPHFEVPLGGEIAAYALLGCLAGLLSPLFLCLLRAARGLYARMPPSLCLRLGLGGLVVGLLSIIQPAVWGNGYSVVDAILQGDWMWQALLSLLLLKVLATAAATGSGAVGGVFTPTLFVGAAIGALFSLALHALWPQAAPTPAYVATAMGAFLAATTHAPLMSAIMIFEMTGNYDVIAPLLLACVLASMVKRVLMADSVYAHAPASHTERAPRATDWLRLGPPCVSDQAALATVEQAFIASRWQHVYALDDSGCFVGAISLHDLGPCLKSAELRRDAPCPAALIKRDFPRVYAEASLGDITQAFSGHSGERLPVLTEQGKVAGYLTKSDLMLVLQERVSAT